VIENSGSIDYLPTQIFVVHMSDEQTLCSEGVWLHIYICASDFVDEGRFADVWVSANKECTSSRIDSGQTRHVLSDLLEISERILLSSHDGGHSSKCCPLELFAAVQTVSELEKTDIVFAYVVYQVLAGIDLAKGKLVVVFIIKNVEQGGEERMQVLE
jgi:hypothetical protein